MRGILIVMALGLLWSGCADELSDLSAPDGAGAILQGPGPLYVYAARDGSGQEVVRGIMRISVDDSMRVSGTWSLRADPAAVMIGPQVGEGTLLGMTDGAAIWMNLNPDYADNNVILLGSFRDDDIEGDWQFVGFPGVLGSGTFQAVQVKG